MKQTSASVSSSLVSVSAPAPAPADAGADVGSWDAPGTFCGTFGAPVVPAAPLPRPPCDLPPLGPVCWPRPLALPRPLPSLGRLELGLLELPPAVSPEDAATDVIVQECSRISTALRREIERDGRTVRLRTSLPSEESCSCVLAIGPISVRGNVFF